MNLDNIGMLDFFFKLLSVLAIDTPERLFVEEGSTLTMLAEDGINVSGSTCVTGNAGSLATSELGVGMVSMIVGFGGGCFGGSIIMVLMLET